MKSKNVTVSGLIYTAIYKEERKANSDSVCSSKKFITVTKVTRNGKDCSKFMSGEGWNQILNQLN